MVKSNGRRRQRLEIIVAVGVAVLFFAALVVAALLAGCTPTAPGSVVFGLTDSTWTETLTVWLTFPVRDTSIVDTLTRFQYAEAAVFRGGKLEGRAPIPSSSWVTHTASSWR